MKKFFLAVLVLLTIGSIHAQRGWEAGGLVGVSHYFGDLNSNFRLTDPGKALAVAARFNFNERVCLRFSGNYGEVSAYDSDSDNLFEQARNLSFQSPLLEANAQFEFNFLPYFHGSSNEFFTPYVLAGLSTVYYNPMTEYNGDLVELRELGTEGQFKGEEYRTTALAINYGIGLKFDINYYWSVNLELSGRRMNSDYLDDVSTVYADKGDIEQINGELAAILSDRSIPIDGVDTALLTEPGRQRGNSSTNDSFAYLRVGLMYYFGELKCPGYGSRK